MEVKTELLDEKGLCRCIARIAYEIIEKNKGVDNLCIVGILSRGAETVSYTHLDVYKRQVLMRKAPLQA